MNVGLEINTPIKNSLRIYHSVIYNRTSNASAFTRSPTGAMTSVNARTVAGNVELQEA
jgi:hypothetical protein